MPLDPRARLSQWTGVRILPLVTVVFALVVLRADAALDPAGILSPRPTGWVVDLARVLSAEDVAELNRLGDTVHAREGAEMAIVTVPTTAGAGHRDFATRLFNHWGIGDRQRNNGVLIFVAVNDRAAEIILGRGIDSDADVAKSDGVMQGEMIPRFRRGENAQAVLAGAFSCAQVFFGVTLERRMPPDAATTPVEGMPAVSERWQPTSRVSAAARGRVGAVGGVPLPAAVGGAGLFGVAAWLGARAWWRRRPRRCGRCSMTMSRLDEQSDDTHLAASERLEERLGSVDYDVWLCPGCGGVDKVRYGRWFSRYSRCAQCGSVTTSQARKTLIAATTSSTGLVEIHEHCENCSHQRTYTRSTPRLSSSSSSSGRSSSGFGGGRSSGRGSSGRW